MTPRRRSTWRVVLGALGVLFLLLLGAVVWLERTLPFSLADLPRLRREGRLDALNTPRGEGGVKTLALTLDLMTTIEGEEVDLAIESLLLLTLWHDRDDLLGPRRPSFEQAAADRELPDDERLQRRPVITSMPIKMQTGSGLKPALLPFPVFDTLRPVALPKVLSGAAWNTRPSPIRTR
ncbi:hypothetical protein [Deinococcus ficus]|uniref:hypothetical protein n=1 Tax=Deinococcus ficus TaxID=317577 RepID=UPI00131B4629|nr:hypothetical protein [Deinococcus ficus]